MPVVGIVLLMRTYILTSRERRFLTLHFKKTKVPALEIAKLRYIGRRSKKRLLEDLCLLNRLLDESSVAVSTEK